YSHDVNLLKGGILYSDYVTTVSPNYAKEVFTPCFGMGLEKVLEKHKDKFCGILNGIDYSYWNPEIDPLIPHHFSINNLTHSCHPLIAQKWEIKKDLQGMLGLNHTDKPLFSCITRLVSQKGPELIKHAIEKTLKKGGQFILLGSCADPKTQEQFLK